MDAGCADSQARLFTAEPAAKSSFGGGLVVNELFDDSAGAVLHKVSPPVEEQPAAADRDRRLIIYTADLHVRVSNLDDAKKKYLELVKDSGGFLQRQENQTLTCRIPAERFEETLAAVRKYGAVLHQSIEAIDVSRQYLDLEIRLDNAMKSRDRLLKLLEQADKVADLLEVEKELKRLCEEIERMKGEMRYLADQASYSTIQITFNGPTPSQRPQGRVYSRFSWINLIGVDYVLKNF